MKLEEIDLLKYQNVNLRKHNLILQSPLFNEIVRLVQEEEALIKSLLQAKELDETKYFIDINTGEIKPKE